ncbi:MAG: ComF family protein [Clostridiales bacterium]|nr:ComF family protein [Clostridiales bacterium]
MKFDGPFAFLADLLFPPRCALCGAVVPFGVSVCPACEKECVRVDTCRRIDLAENGKTISCMVPYRYDGKVREAIIRFKFYGQTRSADFFGRQIAGLFPDAPRFDFVTAVPISKERRRTRGYNQSELVARRAAGRLALPYREVLIKTIDNREQHKLDRKERRGNVKGVYRAAGGGSLQGASVLLIDDIVTTGATLGECAKVLLHAGAKSVRCAAISEVLL